MENQNSETKMKKNSKKIGLIIGGAVLGVIALAALLIFIIIPSIQYGSAEKAIAAGDYITAYHTFISLEGFRDSSERADGIYNDYLKQKLRSAETGDSFLFGAYEQDNNLHNGAEKLEWIVLAKEEGKVLVLSKYAIECLPYNQIFASAAWETCTLRTWLNEDFLKTAFTAAEQKMIPVTTVTAEANPQFDTNPGNDTQDQVFVLSAPQALQYESYPEIMLCQPTESSLKQGVCVNENNHCSWWLRSPGMIPADTTAVSPLGYVYEYGNYVFFNFFGVRPAMWITLGE